MNTNDNNGNISRNSNKDAEDKVDKQEASIPELSFTFRKKDNPLKSIRFYMNGCYIVQGVYETGTIKDGTLTFEKSKGSPVKVEKKRRNVLKISLLIWYRPDTINKIFF